MDGVVNVAYRIDGEAGVFSEQTFNFNPIDVNEDGNVNMEDLVLVLDDWGQCDCPSDVTGDDLVNVVDLILVVVGWMENIG